jgi:hypothetical protein
MTAPRVAERPTVKLIVALPNPGCRGVPRGLFYRPDTEEGRRQASEFMRTEDRPGWGVFQCMLSFHENAGMQEFSDVLRRNGWKRQGALA